MGPFKNSHGYEHILVMVDYVSKWVESMPCRKASTEESIAMIKSMIFPHFGTPRILISIGASHFTGKNFKKCLPKKFLPKLGISKCVKKLSQCIWLLFTGKPSTLMRW
jgi:hypothetical protein